MQDLEISGGTQSGSSYSILFVALFGVVALFVVMASTYHVISGGLSPLASVHSEWQLTVIHADQTITLMISQNEREHTAPIFLKICANFSITLDECLSLRLGIHLQDSIVAVLKPGDPFPSDIRPSDSLQLSCV